MRRGFDKSRLKRDIERERRKALRERLRELKTNIKTARKTRQMRLRQISVTCASARKALSVRCGVARSKTRQIATKRIEGARAMRDTALAEDRLLRDFDRRERAKGPGLAKAVKAEQRRESDDEVRSNLPPDLAAVFTRVRRSIHGNARISRTEAFLHWAEENPGEVYAMQSEAAERDLARMVAEHHRLERHSRRASLSAVPF